VPVRELLAITLGLLAEQRIEIAEREHAATLTSSCRRSGPDQPQRDALADWRLASHTDLAPGADARALMVGTYAARHHQVPPVPLPRPPTCNEALASADKSRSSGRACLGMRSLAHQTSHIRFNMLTDSVGTP
jgi:hypothetical protein